MKYWWAGFGLLVLSLLYVAPVVATFRSPSMAAQTAPFPALSVPRIVFPELKVPAVRQQAPLPALPRATKPQAASPASTTQSVVPNRVPVVSDTHTQQAAAPAPQGEA